jgi:predicted phage terminase large subunit-like protein
MPVSRLIDAGLQLAGRYQPHGFGVEANQFQELLANEFLREQQARNAPPLPLFTITNTVNKELRIQRLGPLLMNRMLVFRDTPDCRLLVSQLRDFPLGQHDDGPDALEMAIRLLSETSGVDTTERILGRVA